MAELGDGFELGQGEDFAAGIGGRVQQNGARARRNGGAHGVHIEMPVGLGQRDQHGFTRSDLNVLHVVAVERLKDQHLVAGIEQRHGRGMQAGRGAGGHHALRSLGRSAGRNRACCLAAIASRSRAMPSHRV